MSPVGFRYGDLSISTPGILTARQAETTRVISKPMKSSLAFFTCLPFNSYNAADLKELTCKGLFSNTFFLY
jgi:hypothetical protein